MRSLFGVPMDNLERLGEAVESAADALMLDLTDLVAEARKHEARSNLQEFLAAGSSRAIWVRVARTHQTDAVKADLDAAVRPGLLGIIIPECESPEEIHAFDGWLAELERDRGLAVGTVRILPLPETALAIRNYYHTLGASSRVAAAWFPGAPGGDLCRDVGYRWSDEGSERIYMRLKVLHEARAAGIDHILDSGSSRVLDLEGYESECRISNGYGFTGRFGYTAGHAEAANRAYAPTQEEVAAAERELATLETARSRGMEMVEIDGRLVDVASAKYAKRVLAQAGRVA
jgi:citrate lyase subunit beta/citryl-CoA lyase